MFNNNSHDINKNHYLISEYYCLSPAIHSLYADHPRNAVG